MPWPSNGDYYGFKEDAIKSFAPPIAGVYGIYNYNHHILIGHSNNIREALLRHHKETDFRFRRLQPTGFTFETCPTESKNFRAQELTWEYDPILSADGRVGLKAWWRSWVTPSARAFHRAPETTGKPSTDTTAKPVLAFEPAKTHVEHTRSRRDEYAMLTSGIAFAIVAIALYVLLGENKTIAEGWTRRLLALAQGVTSSGNDRAPSGAATPQQVVSTNPAKLGDAPIQAHSNADVAKSAEAVAEPSQPNAGLEAVKTPDAPATNSASRAARSKNAPSRLGWSVQALATTDRQDAMNWLDRLKAKGYDAYIVQAEIKGLNWYRVRVGNLESRQAAEELNDTLKTREGFRDAFIASSAKSDIILVSETSSGQFRQQH